MTDREKMFVYETALMTIIEVSDGYLKKVAVTALKVGKERSDEEEYND